MNDHSLVVKYFQPVENSEYKRTLDPLPGEDRREVLISLPSGFTVERWPWYADSDAAIEVSERSHIKAVIEEGYAVKPPAPKEAEIESVVMTLAESVRWHGIDKLHEAGFTGHGETIAILDTGISAELAAALGNRLIFKGSTVPGETWEDKGAESGHGTFCADAASTFAPDAKIIVIKVISSETGWGYTNQIIAGYAQARDAGATIITASLGGPGDPTDAMCQTLNEVSRSGVLCCSAAGNEQRGHSEYMADRSHPGCAEESVTVAAMDSDRAIAYFSNWGVSVKVSALGVAIEQAGQSWSGTSMSTPQVAGIVACIGNEGAEGAAEIKKLLYAGCDDSEYDPWKEGYGVVDGLKILELVGLPPDLDLDPWRKDAPRVSLTKYVAGGYKATVVVTKRGKPVAWSSPAPEGAK